MSKISRNIYDGSRKASKVARTINNVEDLAHGRVDKVIKREVRRNVRKKVNKVLNKIFRKIGM